MCGINVAVSSNTPRVYSPQLASRLQNRGPDHLGRVVEGRVGSTARILTFTSTVLSLRGDHVTKQPFVSGAGSVLCWNGEAWKIAGRRIDGNDGEAIFTLLTNASASSPESQNAVLDALRSIEGPFAFVYFDKPACTLFFGRDRLGRRSLEIHQDNTSCTLVLSSVPETCHPDWMEVEADGIYSVRLGDASGALVRSRHDWQASSQDDLVSSFAPHVSSR